MAINEYNVAEKSTTRKNSVKTIDKESLKDHKKIQKKDTKNRLQQIFDNIEDGVALVSLDGVIVYCNKASLLLLGLTQGEELIGKNVYDSILPEDRQQAMNGASQVLKSGKTVNQVRVKRKNGPPFWAEISVTTLYDNSTPAFFLGVTRDITERKKMEEDLKESEELYRTLFDNSDDGFILVEPVLDKNLYVADFKFLKINRAFERLTGTKANTLLGKSVNATVPNINPSFFTVSKFVLKNQKAKHTELFDEYSRKWYDSYYFPFGTTKVGILFRDITKQKNAEQALRHSEEQYRLYVESSPVAFFVIDSDQKYIQVNDAASKLLGYSKEELLKLTIFDVTFKEDTELTEKQYKQLMHNGRSTMEYRLKKKNGQPVYIILNSILLPDGRAMAFCENITERKNLEKQLRDSERLAAIGQTAGMVGHDIRNPLQAITGDLFLIETTLQTRPDCASEDIAQSLESINENIVYINKIVSDLQDYTRAMEPTLTDIQLKSLIVNALGGRRIPDEIQLQIDVDQDIWIKTDATYLKRIISNLVGNAIQAMPSGGKLTISAFQDDNNVAFTVEDTGVGIRDEDKLNLFKPLFTTKAKGQGLGLAVVKRFVEALKGQIEFETQVLKGTKFTIILPKNT